MVVRRNKEPNVRPVPNRIFEGETAIIVAGGPSLRKFDFTVLQNYRNVVAVNKSYEVCPKARILYWSDNDFYALHRTPIEGHDAPYKVTGVLGLQRLEIPEHIFTYKLTSKQGYKKEKNLISHGNNSGYAAVCISVKLGATSIILLGFDFSFDAKGRTHWHDGHYDESGRKKRNVERTLTSKMLPYFDTIKPDLDEMGIKIYNGSPNSNLELWPRGDPYEFLEAYGNKR